MNVWDDLAKAAQLSTETVNTLAAKFRELAPPDVVRESAMTIDQTKQAIMQATGMDGAAAGEALREQMIKLLDNEKPN